MNKIIIKIKKILSIFNKKKNCEHDEYCPIYLSYLSKYKDNKHKKLKYCKNSNVQYCKKYKLLNEDNWKKLDTKERLKIIKETELINFLEKK